MEDHIRTFDDTRAQHLQPVLKKAFFTNAEPFSVFIQTFTFLIFFVFDSFFQFQAVPQNLDKKTLHLGYVEMISTADHCVSLETLVMRVT